MLERKQAVTQISLTACKEALVQGTRGASLVVDKEGLVMITRRTSAQAVPVCVRVLTAPPTLYFKSRCGLNNVVEFGLDLIDIDAVSSVQKSNYELEVFM